MRSIAERLLVEKCRPLDPMHRKQMQSRLNWKVIRSHPRFTVPTYCTIVHFKRRSRVSMLRDAQAGIFAALIVLDPETKDERNYGVLLSCIV